MASATRKLLTLQWLNVCHSCDDHTFHSYNLAITKSPVRLFEALTKSVKTVPFVIHMMIISLPKHVVVLVGTVELQFKARQYVLYHDVQCVVQHPRTKTRKMLTLQNKPILSPACTACMKCMHIHSPRITLICFIELYCFVWFIQLRKYTVEA